MNKKYYYWTFFIVNILILLIYNLQHRVNSNIINIMIAITYGLIMANIILLIIGYKKYKYNIIEIISTLTITSIIGMSIIFKIQNTNIDTNNYKLLDTKDYTMSFIECNIIAYSQLIKYLILPITQIAMYYRCISSNQKKKRKKINITNIFYQIYFLINLICLSAFLLQRFIHFPLYDKTLTTIVIILNILTWIDVLLLIIFYKKEKFSLLEAFSIGIFALISLLSIIRALKQETEYILGIFPITMTIELLYTEYYVISLLLIIPLYIAMYYKYIKLKEKKRI